MQARFIKSGRVCKGKSAELWISLGLAEEVGKKEEKPVAKNESAVKEKPKRKRKPTPKKRGRKPAGKK